jgi:molybdate transport system substrate-binding protein
MFSLYQECGCFNFGALIPAILHEQDDKMKNPSLAAVGVVLLLAQGVATDAAEVKLIAVPAMAAVIGELSPQFESATGHKLVIQWAVTGIMKQKIEAGDAFDLAIGPAPLMDSLSKQGKLVAGTNTRIARVGHAVGVRAGAHKPDISTTGAFKHALLNATSVTYIAEGATGTHLAKVLGRLGIAEQMKTKTKLQRLPESIGQAVASGEAELGFAVANILLSVPGVELAGLFPPELQDYLVVTANVGIDAEQPNAANALIKLLIGPGAVEVIKAKGLEPVAP